MSDWEKPFSLEADETIGLGGVNKKTNRPNPTKIEGYYLGFKEIPKKKGQGVDKIHHFQTPKGMLGVWGKTHMDRELKKIVLGTMTKVTFLNQTRETPVGPMWLYEVVHKKHDVVQIDGVTQSSSIQSASSSSLSDAHGVDSEDGDDDTSELGLFEDEQPLDEPSPVPQVSRTTPPRVSGRTNAITAEQQARVSAILLKR